ncbi:MAG: MltA domain-containing protein [Pseudomonadota bacterium]
MLSRPVSFDSLPGWSDDDHASAMRAFEKSASRMRQTPHRTRSLGPSGESLARIANWAYHLDEGILGSEARLFFETHFVPRKVISDPGDHARRGFVTGYFEPEVEGSLTRQGRFQTPLLRRPDDLVEIDRLPAGVALPAGWDETLRFARLVDGRVEPYFDRPAIEQGAIDIDRHALVYLEDPIDAFFIHIQGSARIRLQDGEVIRVGFDGKSGHPYSAIGRFLIEEGAVSREDMSMQAIRTWLTDNRSRQFELMWRNRSFIFFRMLEGLSPDDGPVGAAGVQLMTGRSLAVDRMIHTFGVPIYLNADLDTPFRRLMVAQDTGSAIIGPARGDIFFGSGEAAEIAAGAIKHDADFFLLWPKDEPV